LVLLKALGIADDLAIKISEGVSATLPEHFVPKDKYNSKAEEVKTLNAQIAERDKQLTDLKKSADEGGAALRAKIETLETENKTAKETADNAVKEAEKKFNQQALDLVLSNEIVKAKGKNEKAIKALLDLDLIKMADGKLTGFEEQIKNIKAKDAYLFEDTQDPGLPPGGNPANTYVGKAFASLTTEERVAFKQKDPAGYDLQRQAYLLNGGK